VKLAREEQDFKCKVGIRRIEGRFLRFAHLAKRRVPLALARVNSGNLDGNCPRRPEFI
jgi:hypothetical protein